jgi:hypothetical protein
MREHLVFDKIFGQFAGALVSNLVVGEVEFDDGDVEGEPGGDELEELVVDEVAAEVEGDLG